jgi:hypothetical protein
MSLILMLLMFEYFSINIVKFGLDQGPVLLVMFRLVSAYSLSQNTIESAETSQLFYLPNQPQSKSNLQFQT